MEERKRQKVLYLQAGSSCTNTFPHQCCVGCTTEQNPELGKSRFFCLITTFQSRMRTLGVGGCGFFFY